MKNLINVHSEKNNLILAQTGFQRKKNNSRRFKVYKTTVLAFDRFKS